MRVLVSGSLRGIDPKLLPSLQDASRELGKALAQAGHTLLVGSDNPDDVDPFVVDGYQKVAKAAPVEVHLQEGAAACYVGKKNIENSWHRYKNWDVTVLEVVRYEAQAVIAIAGRDGVVQAGIAGWMLGRATIAFGGFGGGARTVWEYGSSDRRRFYFDALSDVEIDQLNSPWGPTTATKIVAQLARCAEASRRVAVPGWLRLTLGFCTLLALAVWIMMLAIPLLGWLPAFSSGVSADGTKSFDASSGVRMLTMLGSVCAAGAFGAFVQSMRSLRDGATITGQKMAMDAVLGVAAGFLAATLYMLAQIAISGTLDLPSKPADYSRVTLIVSMAAVFASLYLDAAFSRFDSVKDSVLSGTYGKKAAGK